MRDQADNVTADLLPPELAELEAVAAAADARIAGAAALPGAPGAEPAPAVDRGAEFGAMLQMAVMMGTPALPFLPQCYTPEVCGQIGTAFAAVAEKYGWNLDGLSSPELALAVVAIPPTVTAVVLGREHFADRRRQAEAAARAQRAPAPATAPLPQITGLDPTPSNVVPIAPQAGFRVQPLPV